MNGRLLFLSLLMILFVETADATTRVTYEFDAYSSYPVAGITSFTGSFTYTSTHFITASGWTFVPASALSECSTPDATCWRMAFSPNAYNANRWDVVEFGVKNTPDGTWTGLDYYFDLGAISAAGNYDSIVLGPAQAGHLVITVADIPAPPPYTPPPCEGCPDPGHHWNEAGNPPASFPIPEPETYAMLLAGLGLLGFVARRRKQKAE